MCLLVAYCTAKRLALYSALVYNGKMLYIPSFDSFAHVFPRGLVVVRMCGERRVPGSIPAVAKDFFFHSYYCILISKDGCEKGHGTPRSWT